MDTSDFLPSEENLDRIRRDLASYEERRKLAHAAVRWRVPVIMGGFALLVVLASVLLGDVLFDNRYFYFGVAAFAAAAFTGIYLYQFARKPARDLQESFRKDLFASIFAFIDNFRHWRGARPGSFDRLPRSVTGKFNNQIFDDEISGRFRDFRFNFMKPIWKIGRENRAARPSRASSWLSICRSPFRDDWSSRAGSAISPGCCATRWAATAWSR